MHIKINIWQCNLNDYKLRVFKSSLSLFCADPTILYLGSLNIALA